MTDRLIYRNARTITFSLPHEMAGQVQEVIRDEGRTISELICEALRDYMEEHEWLWKIRYQRLRKRETDGTNCQYDRHGVDNE